MDSFDKQIHSLPHANQCKKHEKYTTKKHVSRTRAELEIENLIRGCLIMSIFISPPPLFLHKSPLQFYSYLFGMESFTIFSFPNSISNIWQNGKIHFVKLRLSRKCFLMTNGNFFLHGSFLLCIAAMGFNRRSCQRRLLSPLKLQSST